MQKIFYSLVLIWPLVTSLVALHFYKKQNSTGAWTGGPISKPKSMWLAYTVCNWFFLPLWMLGAGLIPEPLVDFYIFHLLSWWLRGPLELIMIYKWLNWTPKYGISHDLFHLLGTSFFLTLGLKELPLANLSPTAICAVAFSFVIILTTIAEIWFAYLFFTTRTAQETDENIYFASEDPKWKFINKATASVVYPAYIFLFLQTLGLAI